MVYHDNKKMGKLLFAYLPTKNNKFEDTLWCLSYVTLARDTI